MNSSDPLRSTFATRLLASAVGVFVAVVLLKQPNLTQGEISQLLADITTLLGLFAMARQLPPDKPLV